MLVNNDFALSCDIKAPRRRTPSTDQQSNPSLVTKRTKFDDRKYAEETAKLIIKMINTVTDRVTISFSKFGVFLTYICRHFHHCRQFVMILTEINSLHKITFSLVADPLTQSLSGLLSNMKATTFFIVWPP